MQNHPPPTDRIIPQEPNLSIPNATLDKLVSEVAQLKTNQVEMMAFHVYIKTNQAEIKTNQVEIKTKLDLVLQLEQKLLNLFQVFGQKKDRPTVLTSATDEADRASTPFPTNNLKMVVYQPSPATPSVKIMPASDMEKRKFKRRKHPPIN